jgi:hypothetical protein
MTDDALCICIHQQHLVAQHGKADAEVDGGCGFP